MAQFNRSLARQGFAGDRAGHFLPLPTGIFAIDDGTFRVPDRLQRRPLAMAQFNRSLAPQGFAGDRAGRFSPGRGTFAINDGTFSVLG
ncbi:hypothetical protein VSR34_36965 [Paraburkholderia sp. JHI2823]|uniref:hypothetical protein n=1 Tax=Paraburkholderia sp. JHI2823 TaxID=3112960 RepID=UPI00317ABD56